MQRTRHSIFRVLLILILLLPTVGNAQSSGSLQANFSQPPLPARPRTLWMWMNGNVTADGITRDLEAMKRVGLGGALVFNIGEFIPKGPIDYGKQPWLNLMTHAAREANRHGLELGMHNCPGWSSSGGPWITPEMSMQRLVWSETRLSGETNALLLLPRPFSRLNFYRDICVLAFPSLPGEDKPFAQSLHEVRDASGVIKTALLTDSDLATTVPAAPDNPLVLEFKEPIAARAITILYTSGGSTVAFNLESSEDGVNFQPIIRLTPAVPRAIEDGSLVASFEPVRAKYFRITPARARGVCEVELHSSARIPDWNYKANHSFRSAQPDGPPAPISREFTIDPKTVLNLTEQMDANGNLRWTGRAGNWTIIRFGFTPRGQENIAAPDAGVGLECDKMSREAVGFHFEHGLGPLMKALGPLAGTTFTGLEVDSYEVGVQNWTAGFEVAFERLNGYAIEKYLPAMTGRYVGDAGISERFLWDLRRTQAQLVADNYYGELRNIGARHGVKILAEPYGAGPGTYDELQIAGRVDVPMGEFWAHFPWDDMASIRLAASAAHVHGRSLVAGEAFTSTEEQSRFLDYPFGLKTTGDLAFSLGLNQMYFHRYAHQPHPSAVPGMTMGPWGFNFDRNNPWFEKSSGWISYLARCQFLLQQGHYAADVLYFTGEGSPQMSKRLVPELPAGYQFDAVDAEVLLKQARVRNGRIHLGDGNGYRLLALPPGLKSMTPELLRKLLQLGHDGAVLVGERPQFSPTLRNFPDADAEFRQICDDLWPATGGNSESNSAGSGRVFPKATIGEALTDLQVAPAFEFTGQKPDASVVWLHRRTTEAEIYFVANRQRRQEEIMCTFRVHGKQPEIWRPETGDVETCVVFDYDATHTRLPLRLKPAESVFVVFRRPAASAPVQWVARDGVKVITTVRPQGRTGDVPSLPAHTLSNNFTVAVWIKPDTDLMAMPQEGGTVAENGKSWVLPAAEGDRLHGEAHASLGIAAGRNGVILAERTSTRIVASLVSRTALSGWTHLAVVCRDGKPTLYLNGKLDRAGRPSTRIIHPGIAAPPPGHETIYYFDGDMTEPKAWPTALAAEEISTLAEAGLPAPETPNGFELRQADGKLEGNFWQPGHFTLSGGQSWAIASVPDPVELTGPWQLSFPADSGAPDDVRLERLASLQKHPDPAVRHFGGTVTYRTSFVLKPDALKSNHRQWLDLGRLAVIGEVRLNGKELGLLWRPPYRVDISRALQPGTNHVEIRVTTLLANRLIGDESRPSENDYDSRTRAIRRIPDWFSEGKPKPAGGRATFSTWQFFKANEPLVEAGLLGPVRILTSISAAL